MAPDATEGKELRPPSLDRRRNAAGSQEHAAASRVMSSASPTHRTAARRVTAWRVRYGGTAVSRSEPTGSEVNAPRGRASQPGWMTRHARMFGTLAPASEARSVKMIILHNAPRLCAGRLRKRSAPAVHNSGVGGAGPDKAYRIGPPGCRGDRAYIIPATLDARPASCGLRPGGECPDRHGGAWRTSLAHCTSSPRCPLPDRI